MASITNALQAYVEGVALLEENDYEDALKMFDLAIACGYKDPAVWENRGICLQGIKMHHDAIDDFSKAIASKSNDCNLYYMRAISKINVGDKQGFTKDLQKAIAISKVPSEINSQYSKGVIDMGYKSIEEYYINSSNPYFMYSEGMLAILAKSSKRRHKNSECTNTYRIDSGDLEISDSDSYLCKNSIRKQSQADDPSRVFNWKVFSVGISWSVIMTIFVGPAIAVNSFMLNNPEISHSQIRDLMAGFFIPCISFSFLFWLECSFKKFRFKKTLFWIVLIIANCALFYYFPVKSFFVARLLGYALVRFSETLIIMIILSYLIKNVLISPFKEKWRACKISSVKARS